MSLLLKPLSPVTIVTAGSRVAISALPVYASTLTIAADSLNTGKVYVGDNTVSSTNGVELTPGQSLGITCDPLRGTAEGIQLSDIYVDTATNGNKVRIFYLARK